MMSKRAATKAAASSSSMVLRRRRTTRTSSSISSSSTSTTATTTTTTKTTPSLSSRSMQPSMSSSMPLSRSMTSSSGSSSSRMSPDDDEDFNDHHRPGSSSSIKQDKNKRKMKIQQLLDFLTLSWKFDELQSGKTRFASHVLGLRCATAVSDDRSDGAENDATTVTPSLIDLEIVDQQRPKQQPEPAAVTAPLVTATTPFFSFPPSFPVLKYRYKIPPQLALSSVSLMEVQQKQEQQQLVIGGGGGRGNVSDRVSVPLSCLVALLDEVTTWSIIMETLSSSKSSKSPRPGVSVSLSARWVHDNDNGDGDVDSTTPPPRALIKRPQVGNHIDILTTITKLGTTMGFCRADVVDSETGLKICTFEHIKYLPTGSSWLLYLGLSPLGQFLLKLYVKYVLQHPWFVGRQRRGKQRRSQEEEEIVRLNENTDTTTNEGEASSSSESALGLLDTLVFTSSSNNSQDATFIVKDIHTNGFGGLQGGVQAILMERVASRVASQYFCREGERGEKDDDDNNDVVECTQLQISYQSTASKQVHLHAEIISSSSSSGSSKGDAEVTVRVMIFKKKTNNKNDKKKATKQAGSNVVKKSDDPLPLSVVVVSEGILTFRKGVNVNDKCQREYR